MCVLGKEFDSAARLSKRKGSMWNCLWGHPLKRSPVIIRKSSVLYLGPGFLSSTIWPSLPRKHVTSSFIVRGNSTVQCAMVHCDDISPEMARLK